MQTTTKVTVQCLTESN